MGKKRRILTRTTKFAKKYFEFLDKVDGTDDDIIDTSGGRGDPFIDTVTVTDLNNQTVTVAGTAIGLKAGDKVEFSVDGGTFGNEKTVTTSGTGLATVAFTQTINSAAGDGHSVGTHTFTVRKKDATDVDLHKSETAHVRENLIVLTVDNDAFTDTNANQIKFDASKVTVAAGDWKDKAGSTDIAFLGAGGGAGTAAIGLKITVSHNGTLKSILNKDAGGAATSQTIAKTATFTNDTQDIDTLLAADADAAGEPLEGGVNGTTTTDFICTVVPVDSAGNALEDSAVRQTVTVTKRA